MWNAEAVVRELRRSGELWSAAPGLIGLRGPAMRLYDAIERTIGELSRDECPDEWRCPPATSLGTLARADYFASFPQWLTTAAHLGGDSTALEAIATAADPAAAVRRAPATASVALCPALCYHAYERFAGTTIVGEQRITTQGTCWRHEGPATAPLERGWAFTMREMICIGTEADVETFRRAGLERVVALARSFGLEPKVAPASDPFFAPTARGKALLQQAKGLKQELRLSIGDGRTIAAASFNRHETFFGDAFEIELGGGRPASSACIAFGLERWLLAFLVAHGLEPDRWPPVGSRKHHAGPVAVTAATAARENRP